MDVRSVQLRPARPAGRADLLHVPQLAASAAGRAGAKLQRDGPRRRGHDATSASSAPSSRSTPTTNQAVARDRARHRAHGAQPDDRPRGRARRGRAPSPRTSSSSAERRASPSYGDARRRRADRRPSDADTQEVGRLAATRRRPGSARAPAARPLQQSTQNTWLHPRSGHPADPRPQGLALARPGSASSSRCCSASTRAGVYRGQGELVDPEARARPRGRHADHPRGADGRDGSPSPRSRSTRPSRSSASASTRRVSPRPRSPPRAAQHRRPDPGRARRGDAQRIEASAKLRAARRAARGCPPRPFVGERRAPRPRTRPTRPERARVDADRRADRRQRPGLDHPGAAGRVPRLRLRRPRRRPDQRRPGR